MSSSPIAPWRRFLTSYQDQRPVLKTPDLSTLLWLCWSALRSGGFMVAVWGESGVNNLAETSSIIKLSPERNVAPQALPRSSSSPHPYCVPGPERDQETKRTKPRDQRWLWLIVSCGWRVAGALCTYKCTDEKNTLPVAIEKPVRG